MPQAKRSRQGSKRQQRRPSMNLPGTSTKVYVPDRAGLLWYAGIGAMAAAELIEWPIALLVAGTHFVENHSRNRDLDELTEGIEAGA